MGKTNNHKVVVIEEDNDESKGLAGNNHSTPLPSISEINKIQREFYKNKYNFEPEPYTNQNEFYNLDLDVLEIYVKNNFFNEKNPYIWNARVAKNEDIILDFKNVDSNISSPKLKYNIIPRTTLGHAQSGHSTFSINAGAFPNTALEDIISNETIVHILNDKEKSVYSSSEDYLNESHQLSLEISKMFEKALESDEEYFYLVDDKGAPLFGIELFKHLKLSTQAFLKGGFFGGMFDNYKDIRTNSETILQTAYGGGEAFLLDRTQSRLFNFNLDNFSEQYFHNDLLDFFMTHEHRIKLFKKLGILVEKENIDYSIYDTWENLVKAEGVNMTSPEIKERYIQQYVRIKKGRGGSDDTLIGLASLIDIDKNSKYLEPEYIFAKRLGAQLIDALDTIEKSTLYFLQGGHDEGLARFFEKKWIKKARENESYRKKHNINIKDLEKEEFVLIDKPQIIRLTALGINPLSAPLHSSTRYFLKVQNLESATQTTSMEQEMLFLQQLYTEKGVILNKNGAPYIPGKLASGSSGIKIGFHQQPFEFFKAYFTKAFKIGFEMYSLPEPNRDEFLVKATRAKTA